MSGKRLLTAHNAPDHDYHQSQPVPGGVDRQEQTRGPQQEIAGTLPTDFTLANTKAESKGEDRQPIFVSFAWAIEGSMAWC